MKNKKVFKGKGKNGHGKITVTIEEIDDNLQDNDVQAYQEPEEPDFVFESGNKRLTITIAE